MLIKTAHEKSAIAKNCKGRFQLKFPLFFCIFTSLVCINQKSNCQDITAPRFFEFNVRPTTAPTSTTLPQTPSVIAPQTKLNYHVNVALKFPIKLNGDTKIIGEVKYKNEFLNGFYSIEDDKFESLELKQSKVSLILWRDLNERVRFTNVLSASSNSADNLSFNKYALRFRNISMFEKKLSKGSIGVGAFLSYNQKLKVLPVFKYETTFAKNWALEILLPKNITVSKDLTKTSRLSFAVKASNANYSLGEWQMADGNIVNSTYKRIDIRGLVGYQKQLTPLIGFSLQVGASMPLSSGTYASDNSQTALYNYKSEISPYFKVGIFLSLPR